MPVPSAVSARDPKTGVRCLAVWACCLLLSALPAVAGPPAVPALQEVRALWVTRTSLTTPAAVTDMVKSARAGGFNTVLVQVRGRGDAYFNGGLEPRAAALAGQPDTFDPLALALALAHAQGLRVHAWVNIALVSSAAELPASRAHIVYRHPEWLMVPRALARDMALLDPRSQLYLDKLTRWTRAQNGDVEGLYASPVQEAAADATVAVVADIVARYPVDGVHLDYTRYPNEEFDYSRGSLEAFKADVAGSLAEGTRRQHERAIGGDLVGWTEAFPERWIEFRRHRLTALVTRLRESVKARRPGVRVFGGRGAGRAGSEPPAPAGLGGMARTRPARRRLPDGLRDRQRGLHGAGRPAPARRREPRRSGRGSARTACPRPRRSRTSGSPARLGARGIVLFSYDSLVSLPRGLDYIAQIGRAAFITP